MAADTLQRRVVVFLDTKGAEGSLKEVEKSVKRLDAELKKLPAGGEEYRKKLEQLARGKAIIEDHRAALRETSTAYRKLKEDAGGMVDMAAKIFTVDTVLQYGEAVFGTAQQMAKAAFAQETMAKKAATVFGPELDRVTMMAKEHAAAMGLTTSQYMNAAAAAQDLLVPMGFTRRAAADISTRLTNLSGALSEWSGGQRSAGEVSGILTKALLGEREELKSLGIAISEEDVKNRLRANGMERATGQVLEQAKAMSTLQLVLEKSTDAQTQFADGAGSNERKLAETEARVASLKEEINMGLLPAWAGLLEATNASVQAADLGFDSWSNFFDLMFSAGNITSVGRAIVRSAPAPAGKGGTLLEEFAGISSDAFAPTSTKKTLSKEDQAALDRQREKARREREQAIKDLATLNKQIAEARQEFEIKASADELKQRLFDIEQRYQSELEKAVELEKKNVRGAAEARAAVEAQIRAEQDATTTEYLRQQGEKARIEQEAAAARAAEQNEAELSAIIEKELAQQESDARYEEGRRAAAESLHFAIMDEQQREIAELERHFSEMLAMAEQYGFDTVALREQFEAQQAAINKKYSEEVAKKDLETANQRIQAAQAMFTGLGELASAAGELFSGESKRAAKIQKAATLAQIAFDTASAIASLTRNSEANPTNSVTFGLAGVAQFAAGFARILLNIKKAKDLLTAAPAVPQRAEGGLSPVMGASDGRAYNARHIGAPGTGLLDYNTPVLLANERGREYFVAAEDLRNPVVFGHVQSIENIRRNRLGQFADGGATASLSAPTTAGAGGGMDSMLVAQLSGAIHSLTSLLAGGIPAVIHDRTLRDMMDRTAKLAAARG